MRANTDSSGAVVGQQGNYPFGEAWYTTSTTTKWRFTSYERDAESGNDYAIFRYHANRLGRFMTPDPLAGRIANPQSLNRYAYVLNDPLNLVDPLGLECVDIPFGPPLCPSMSLDVWGRSPGGGGIGSGVDSHCPGGFNFLEYVCSGGGDSTGGGGVTGGTIPTPDPEGEDPDSPDVEEAKKLLDKNDCAEFIAKIAIKATQLSFGGPLMQSTVDYVNSAVSPDSLKNALGNATFDSKPGVSGKGPDGTTFATAHYNTQTVVLFKEYFEVPFLVGQAQILVHEAVHLSLNFSDQQLGQVATGKTFPNTKAGGAAASEAFQKALAEKCK